MLINKKTATKNSYSIFLFTSQTYSLLRTEHSPTFLALLKLTAAFPHSPPPREKLTSFIKYIWFPLFLISLQYFFALLRALILLSDRSLKTLASNNWKKWLFKDNCNLLNMPDYHMLAALKLQINDEQEQCLSFRGNWPLSNASSLMSSVCCISLCEFHGVKKKKRGRERVS